MSLVEKFDFMLGSYSRGDEIIGQCENEANVDSGSNRSQQIPNVSGEKSFALDHC